MSIIKLTKLTTKDTNDTKIVYDEKYISSEIKKMDKKTLSIYFEFLKDKLAIEAKTTIKLFRDINKHRERAAIKETINEIDIDYVNSYYVLQYSYINLFSILVSSERSEKEQEKIDLLSEKQIQNVKEKGKIILIKLSMVYYKDFVNN